MASAAEQYTTELNAQLHQLATWTPGMPIDVGNIGTFVDHVFSPISSLAALGITAPTTEARGAGERLSFASAGAVSITFKAAGQAADLVPNVPTANAGLGISFTRENATVFEASGLTHRRIEDEIALGHSVAALMRAGLWERDWLIVTAVTNAESTTAIVSRSSGSALEVSLGADVSGGGLELLSAEFSPKVVSSRNMNLSIVGAGSMSPLFKAKRPKRKFFSEKVHLQAAFAADLDVTIEEEGSIFEEIEVYGQLI